MADLFVSYSREDKARAAGIVHLLEDQRTASSAKRRGLKGVSLQAASDHGKN